MLDEQFGVGWRDPGPSGWYFCIHRPCRSASSCSSSTSGWLAPEMLRVPPAPAPMRVAVSNGANHLRMLAHAEIVVRAPDHDRPRTARRMPYACGNRVEIGKHAIARFGVQATKRRGKENHKSSQNLRLLYSAIATSPIQRAGEPHPVQRHKALIGAAGPREGERTDRRRATAKRSSAGRRTLAKGSASARKQAKK